MKRLLLILSALSIVALVAVPTPAQQPSGTRVRVAVDVPPPSVAREVHYLPPPAYAEPPVVYPAYAGTGCRGAVPTGGCIGRAAGSCYGRQAGGCAGFQVTGGCQGRMAAPAMYVPVGSGCAGRMAGCYGGGPGYAPPYGAPLGYGRYATRTGRPPAPGFIPSNDPATKAVRWVFGFDTEY